jgi:Bacterial regulatory proteins, luxR family
LSIRPAAGACAGSIADQPIARGSRLLLRRLALLIVVLSLVPRLAAGQLIPQAAGPPQPTPQPPASQAAGRRVLFLSMKEVAGALGLSPRTVETHKYQIMEALGLTTTAKLIRYAIEHGLTTPPARG